MKTYDFSNISNEGGNNFTPVPENRYELVVSDASVGVTNNGNEKIDVTFTIASGDYKNRKLWKTFVITEKSAVFLNNFLVAVGSKFANAAGFTLQDVANDIVGKKVSAFVGIGKTNKGNPINELSMFKSLNEVNSSVANISQNMDTESNPMFQ